MGSFQWRYRLPVMVGCFLGLFLLGTWAQGQNPPAAPGTTSQVTKANYQKLKTGMTVQEVEAILGPGTDLPAAGFPPPRTRIQLRMKEMVESGDAKALKWQNGRKMIIVVFRNDKLVATSGRNLD